MFYQTILGQNDAAVVTTSEWSYLLQRQCGGFYHFPLFDLDDPSV